MSDVFAPDPSRLDDVESPRPAAFHVFEYRGRRLLYDVNTAMVFEVNNPAAYRLLGELEENGSLASDIRSRCAGADIELVEELSRLENMGLFKPTVPLTEEEVEENLVSLVDHHPNKILLMVSQSCNFRCVYCYAVENNFPDEGKLMDEEIALKAIDHLFKVSGGRKYLTVSFFGGEPLLNFPVIRKVVDYSLAKADQEGKEVEFLMSTNASLITDEIADYLVEHEFSMLVSLDGPPELHNRFRPTKNGGPSHHLSLKGIYRLVRRYSRPHYVKVKAVLNHDNHNLLAVADYLESLGLRNIAIGGSREHPWGCRDFDLYGSDFDALEEQVEKLLDRVLDRLDNGRATGYNPFFHTLRSLGM
ncbi:MAG: radical SAM protein, partial [Candidatus Aquicultorales bacterium]